MYIRSTSYGYVCTAYSMQSAVRSWHIVCSHCNSQHLESPRARVVVARTPSSSKINESKINEAALASTNPMND